MKYSLKSKVLHWLFKLLLYLLKAGSLLRSLGQTFQSTVFHSMDQNSSKIVLSKSHPVQKYIGATVNTISLESHFINIINCRNVPCIMNAPLFLQKLFSSLRIYLGSTERIFYIQRSSIDQD